MSIDDKKLNLPHSEDAKASTQGVTPKKEPINGGTHWLDDHLEILRRKIVSEASTMAKSDARDSIEPRDIAQAAMLFAPGIQFTDKNEEDLPFFRRMALSITGVTLMSALLAAVFGVIGTLQTRAGNAQMANGAFDIAKIFAGAIVGSTGAAVAATIKRS